MEERAAALAGSEQGVQAAGAQKAELPGGFQGEGRGCGEGDRLWTLFRLVGGEVTGSQHHQPFGSNGSGVSMQVGNTQLISSTWWGLGGLVTPLCPTLCDSLDCSPSDSSVHGILQARILERLPFPSSGDLPDPEIEPRSPVLQADSLPSEPQGSSVSAKQLKGYGSALEEELKVLDSV